MKTGRMPVDPGPSWDARRREAIRHEAEFSRIEASLNGIQATLEALRSQTQRKVVAEEEEGPQGGGGRR